MASGQSLVPARFLVARQALYPLEKFVASGINMEQPSKSQAPVSRRWVPQFNDPYTHLLIVGCWLLWWPLVGYSSRWLFLLLVNYVLIGVPWLLVRTVRAAPRASPLRTRIPREGVYWLFAAGILLLVSWLKAINLVLLLAYLLLLLWAVNFFLAGRGLSALRGRRRLDEPLFAGVASQGELTVSNTGEQVHYGVRFVARGGDQPRQWFLPRLGPGEQATLSEQTVWPRRGRFVVPPPQAVSGYPFGLVQRSLDLEPTREVVVLPALGQLDAAEFRRFLAGSAHGDRWERHAVRRQPEGPAELHAMRPYRPGDSPHWIHWRTSARRGELMVREFEEEANEHLVLIVDAWTPRSIARVQHTATGPEYNLLPTRDDQSLFDDVVSLAATICWAARQDTSRRLTLVLAGPQPVLLSSTGPEGNPQLLENLATAAISPEYSHVALLEAMTALPEGPLLVLGVEPEGLVRSLQGEFQRPAAVLRAADLDHCAFYEKPHAR